jgi:hypothetical protein
MILVNVEFGGYNVTDPPASTAKLSDACPYIVQSEVFSLLPTRVDLGIDC